MRKKTCLLRQYSAYTNIRAHILRLNHYNFFEEEKKMKKILLVLIYLLFTWGNKCHANYVAAYYPFSGNANDLSGNNNNGVVNGALLTSDRFGNSDSAYLFDGSNDYIEVPDSDSLDIMEKIYISAWIFPTDVSGYRIIVSKYKDYEGMSYLLELRYGKPYFVPRYDGGVLGNTDIQANNWYHIEGIYDGTLARIYVNGVLDVETALSGQIPVTSQPLNIGRQADNGIGQFAGVIDEVIIAIPEPATLLLLTFGGLILRRRKPKITQITLK
jgi:hypothetical protein